MRTFFTALTLALLSGTTVEAGDIVWRAPVTGVLQSPPSATPSLPTGEGPATSLGISYRPETVVTGSAVSIAPDGHSGGFRFELASGSEMPVGLILNSITGIVSGKAIIAGAYTILVRVTRGDIYEVVPAIITII